MKYEILIHEQICKKLPTIMCHASTVLPLPNGEVLSAWFGGTHEGENDVAVWMSRRENGEWTDPASIVHIDEPHWNPVLQLMPSGNVRLYYKVGAVIADWKTMFCESADGGKTWSIPRELVAGDDSGGRGPVRSKVITLDSGRMLAPCSTERGEWVAYADISDDGTQWRRSNPIRIPELALDGGRTVSHSDIAVSEQSFYGRGVIQPTLWQSAPNKVHMLLRSTEGHIYRSDSSDGGETWCAAYPTALPNNNSGIDLDRLPDGRLALACNPVASNWGARSPMRLMYSDDNGAGWETLIDLDSGVGEFAYPAVVAQENILHITYTWKRQNIAYWQIKILNQE